MASSPLHHRVSALADEIESELKRIHRWQVDPLPEGRFNNMGAFGGNTMGFTQWIQFVLLARIREVVAAGDPFPARSMVGVKAVRELDGDTEADDLISLLSQLDSLINHPETADEMPPPASAAPTPPKNTVTLGSATTPAALIQVAEVLPQFVGADLESQLQSFDVFLNILSPEVRPEIAALLESAARNSSSSESRDRLLLAAADVLAGKRAAAPYDHEAAMKKYREEFRKNFPSADSDDQRG